MRFYRPTQRRRITSVCAASLISILVSTAQAEDWPTFRGPAFQGASTEKDLPTKWSKTENIAWKAPIPNRGWSSPIVVAGRVFITGTSEDGVSCHAICLDTATGKVQWDVEVLQQKPTRKEGKNSYATPTPVADAKNVYVFFSGGGAAALSFDGKVLWTNTENGYYSQHGLGASPRLYKDMLIMPYDQSAPSGDLKVGWQIPWEKSYVLALEAATGKTRYKAMRGTSRIGHVTPLIADVDGKPQLISGAGDVVEGFDPDTGKRIWWADNGGEAVVPSLVVGDGMVFATPGFPTQIGTKSIYPAIRAFRLAGAAGDVTQTNLVWEEKRGVPMVPSYIFDNHLLYAVKEDGMAQCLEAATGKLVWRHRIDGNYASSPVIADGKIYCLNEAGTTTVIEAAREFKEVSVNELDGPCQASMAISDGHLFIRSRDNLWCVGASGK